MSAPGGPRLRLSAPAACEDSSPSPSCCFSGNRSESCPSAREVEKSPPPHPRLSTEGNRTQKKEGNPLNSTQLARRKTSGRTQALWLRSLVLLQRELSLRRDIGATSEPLQRLTFQSELLGARLHGPMSREGPGPAGLGSAVSRGLPLRQQMAARPCLWPSPFCEGTLPAAMSHMGL